ncbi:hypothetical protein [Enterococcus sp. AZ109]|uniref:hypothetical protein n=1 Tax=Enterococcus sp. AZ109 TaxID=2774634 RepID=UPI003F214CC4
MIRPFTSIASKRAFFVFWSCLTIIKESFSRKQASRKYFVKNTGTGGKHEN